MKKIVFRYFTEGALDNVRSNIKDKKILVALFEEGLSLENQGYEEILLNKIKIDISGGSGTGQSYQPNAQQIKSLVEACHVTVFGHGSLGEAFKRSKDCYLFGAVLSSPPNICEVLTFISFSTEAPII